VQGPENRDELQPELDNIIPVRFIPIFGANVLKITISDSRNVFNDSLLSFNEKEMVLWNVDRKRILTGAIVRMSHALGKVFAVNAYHII